MPPYIISCILIEALQRKRCHGLHSTQPNAHALPLGLPTTTRKRRSCTVMLRSRFDPEIHVYRRKYQLHPYRRAHAHTYTRTAFLSFFLPYMYTVTLLLHLHQGEKHPNASLRKSFDRWYTVPPRPPSPTHISSRRI